MHIYNRQLARLFQKQQCRGSFAAKELQSKKKREKKAGHCVVLAI